MNSGIIRRVLEESAYILDTNETIRDMALVFNVSKSTIHKDLHERLKQIDMALFNKVKKALQYHIDVRHIRGGEKTKQKYLKLNEHYEKNVL